MIDPVAHHEAERIARKFLASAYEGFPLSRETLAHAYLDLLAQLREAEKALDGTDLGGIYGGFRDLPDAIEQMGRYIKELEARRADTPTEVV